MATKVNKYFVSMTKTITEDYDFPVFAETPEQAIEIANESIRKGLIGQYNCRDVDDTIDFLRDENMKIVDLESA